ncbi:MAG: hypothetical protein ABR928_16940 [Terracidiphilus sp.]|jgi:hypothetical protein
MSLSIDEDLNRWYVALQDSDKIVFLAAVSHQLTVHGRSFGIDLSGEQQVRALLGLNEIQHQISSHIGSIASKRAKYPEDLILQILAEKASAYGIAAHLHRSLERAQGKSR